KTSTRCCAPSSAGERSSSTARIVERRGKRFMRRRCPVSHECASPGGPFAAQPSRRSSAAGRQLYAVSCFAHCENASRLRRILLELPPQLRYVRVDRPAVHLARVSPHLLEQFRTRHDLPASLQEGDQQVVFLGAQRHCGSAALYRV